MNPLSTEYYLEKCVQGERIVRCPNCQRINVGQVAPKYFYCSDCFIEMKLHDDQISFFELDENGELACLDDIFYT
ncbi:hypothetical protein [Ammoniphilus resinae]|uniref:DUF2797 domain-containing protein n=1 Tax=Ammoniphilus resinae TaxID=861532 RepID=A0ABS4GUH1_9BACL|nr:hypothetical protein [Ammoniphilus resinae]MBP1933919.1 hypothetical protein [Ammoniphilus resinae]